MRVSEPATQARGRAATRERLLASGTELFAARGLHGVTSHDIAHAAGVAAGTFYLHFLDKQALFREIVFDAVRRLRERLDAASEAVAEREAAVRARMRALLEFAEENRDLVRILFARDHAAARIEADVLEFLAGTAEASLRARMERGLVRDDLDPAVAAQALVAMQARVVAWWVEDPSRAARESVVDTLTKLQLQGVEPRARTPQEGGIP